MKSIALSDFDLVEEIPRQVAWKREENDVIETWYVAKGAKYVGRLLPHRSLNSIRARAAQLGLRRWIHNRE